MDAQTGRPPRRMAPFEPGDAVVMRHVRGDWKWAAPMRVIRDDGDFEITASKRS